MKVAVIQFPGSNCDQDALYSLRDDIGVQAEYVWHDSTSLAGFDAAFVPGGFTYGDYLRCGAMAATAPVMDEVRRFAREGRPVAGICNGFQILCEAHILPGALMQNIDRKFLGQDIYLQAVNRTSPWTERADRVLRVPIAHMEGRYVADEETLARLEGEGLVAFRYVSPTGELAEEWNPNGATNAIAGIVNPAGNVLGMMPHPERATRKLLGSDDGRAIMSAFRLLAVN